MSRFIALMLLCGALGGCAAHAPDGGPVPVTGPLVIGETFTIDSRIMGEARRVNVYTPTVYGEAPPRPLPVLYMLDGGLSEDFLHIAGLVQILVSNGGMRPFLLVGIENTVRRRDLPGPTLNADDRKMAPVVGGSATFRRFIREELIPAVHAKFGATGEAAVIGESLAGLFVMETLFLEPGTFDSYIAIDPSLWWNDEDLLKTVPALSPSPTAKSVFVANSREPGLADLGQRLTAIFDELDSDRVMFRYMQLPDETHATVYHPAAMRAFRAVFRPKGAE